MHGFFAEHTPETLVIRSVYRALMRDDLSKMRNAVGLVNRR
jgi:hypothetical protein